MRHPIIGVAGAGCVALSVHCALLVDLNGLAGEGSADSAVEPDSDASDAGAAGDARDAGVDPPVVFGAPNVLAGDLVQPSLVAADEDGVYWIGSTGASIDAGAGASLYRRGATGEAPSSVLMTGIAKAPAIAVNASNIYFSAADSTHPSASWTYLYEVPKTSASAPRRFLGTGAGPTRYPALAVEGTGLAYTESTSNIRRCASDGTNCVSVATSQVGASAVVLRAPYVYWNTANGIMRSRDQAPTAPDVFSADAIGTNELAADGTSLYWVTVDGRLHGLRFDAPGAATTILASDLKAPHGLAVDDRYVYWGDTVTGEVLAIPKSGGERMILATEQVEPYAVAVNSKAVFFVDRAKGELVRIDKL